ncbi:metallophosphoesterase [Planctomycetota bacterium]
MQSSAGIRQVGRALIYPSRGRLMFATDFHGQLEDFRQVVGQYHARREQGEDLYLLFAGDFVHGPRYDAATFPEHLGDFHPDDTAAILQELEALLEHDHRVSSLLGNHEHGHVGGPHTQKFHRDPDEVEHLEGVLGKDRALRMRDLFRSLSLVALAPCGVIFLHGAPNVRTAGFADVAGAVLDGYEQHSLQELYSVPVVGELLWSKGADPEVAEAFLGRMAYESIQPRVAVYGHDVIREGYWKVAHNQLVVSTSFGLRRPHKTLCEVDLAGSYRSTDDFRPGHELYPVYGRQP